MTKIENFFLRKKGRTKKNGPTQLENERKSNQPMND
jgi:hypothetical protein